MPDQGVSTTFTAVVAFGSAIVGAVVGGVASTATAYWVGKKQSQRAEIARLYDELCPQLDAMMMQEDWPFGEPEELVRVVNRAAVLTGDRKIRRLSKRVELAMTAFVGELGSVWKTMNQEQSRAILRGNAAAGGAKREAVLEAVGVLHTELESKL